MLGRSTRSRLINPSGVQVVEPADDENAIVATTLRLSIRCKRSAGPFTSGTMLRRCTVPTLTRMVASGDPGTGADTASPSMVLDLPRVCGGLLLGTWNAAHGGPPATGKGPLVTCAGVTLNTLTVAWVGPSRTVANTTLPSGWTRNWSSK